MGGPHDWKREAAPGRIVGVVVNQVRSKGQRLAIGLAAALDQMPPLLRFGQVQSDRMSDGLNQPSPSLRAGRGEDDLRPRISNPSVRSCTTRSIPPYPVGGTGNQVGQSRRCALAAPLSGVKIAPRWMRPRVPTDERFSRSISVPDDGPTTTVPVRSSFRTSRAGTFHACLWDGFQPDCFR